MGLRNPLYLDADTLTALAEYNDVPTERMHEVVETQRRTRTGGAKLGWGPAGAEGSAGRDVEMQLSYSIEPGQKATVSKIIDGLTKADVLVPFTTEHARKVDDLMEIEGTLTMTATSLAGKMFYLLREYLGRDTTDIENLIAGGSINQRDLLPLIQDAYFGNALPPVPLLMELKSDDFPVRTFVSLSPSGFVDTAEASHIEGERRVLGQVANLVDAGSEGYLSAEKWLLHGWDYTMRRITMATLNTQIADLVETLNVDLPADDVQAYITGPAIVLNAVAVY